MEMLQNCDDYHWDFLKQYIKKIFIWLHCVLSEAHEIFIASWVIFLCLAAAAKSLQSCLTVQPHRRQPTRLPHPWDSPDKNIGVGCHFLLQCMKVKSESEVAQSCLTPSDPMDCTLPGSSIHGIFQARVLEWGAIAFSEVYCISLQRVRDSVTFFV